MANLAELVRVGEIIRTARKAKKLSLEDVADLAEIKPSYLWIIEKSYTAPGRKPTVPSDVVLKNIAKALDIPLFDLHAALGRQSDAATQLVREQLAEYNGETRLDAKDVAELSSEVEDFARVRVERVMRQSQGKGKQLQEQVG